MRAAAADLWGRVASQPAVLTSSPHQFPGGQLLHHNSVTTASHQKFTLKGLKHENCLPQVIQPSHETHSPPRTETTLLPELKAKPVF